MKKILIFMLVACMILCFAGCQSGNGGETQPANNQTAEQIFSFKALGEPMKYTESASCAFDGLDKSYYYGSFYLETYPQGDKDFVYGWWFADDSVSTPEGIYIGAAQADVEKAYGAENFNGTNAFSVKKGNGTLTIILDKGLVTSIQYTMNVE